VRNDSLDLNIWWNLTILRDTLIEGYVEGNAIRHEGYFGHSSPEENVPIP
jgi:hypothetical protein